MIFLKFLNKFFSALIAVLAVAVVFVFFTANDGGFAQDIQPKQTNAIEQKNDMTPALGELKQLTHIPAFQLNGIGSADFTDDVMILNFFSVWCDKCARENVLFNDFVKKYNTPLYGINIFTKEDDDTDGFFRQVGNPYKKWGKDDFSLISQAFGFPSIPVSMIITPDLKIHWRHDGELTQEIIEEDMVPLLKELSAPRSILSLSHLPASEKTDVLPHSEGRE
jgi:cytochrome c biogenesis protein CcmG/thiol:disulfide interchange protein DsbE